MLEVSFLFKLISTHTHFFLLLWAKTHTKKIQRWKISVKDMVTTLRTFLSLLIRRKEKHKSTLVLFEVCHSLFLVSSVSFKCLKTFSCFTVIEYVLLERVFLPVLIVSCTLCAYRLHCLHITSAQNCPLTPGNSESFVGSCF